MNNHLLLRMACPDDAQALLDIYTPYVLHTAVTFEYEVPTAEEFAARIQAVLEKYPYLIAELDGTPVGYAYATPFRTRAAYSWCVETTVYVKQECRGMGVGKKLYERLHMLLAQQNVLNCNACIAIPNPDSLVFHERFGYSHAGRFNKCGFKQGQWHDIVWLEKHLAPHTTSPSPVIPIKELSANADVF